MNEETDLPLWRTSETWPYTDLDLTRIGRTLGRPYLSESSVDLLTDAAMAYCLTIIADRNHGEKQRQEQFSRIATLASKLAKQLRRLNAMSSQQLRMVGPDDLDLLALSADGAVDYLPSRGSNPAQARRDFVGDLYDIFAAETGEAPTRSKKGKDGREAGMKTQFERFVEASLRPINPSALQGLRRDIKTIIQARHDIE